MYAAAVTVAVLLAGALAAGLVILVRVQSAGGPGATVVVFCADEVAQRYTDAYALFTPQYQATVGERLWLQFSRGFERRFGRTLSCGLPAGYEVSDRGPGPLRIPLDIRLEREHAIGGADATPGLTLVRVGTKWKIDQVRLPVVLPSAQVAMSLAWSLCESLRHSPVWLAAEQDALPLRNGGGRFVIRFSGG